jgi:hypothetical protein
VGAMRCEPHIAGASTPPRRHGLAAAAEYTIPLDNPPGLSEALWPLPGSVLGLVASYLYGARNEGTAAEPH